MGHLFQWENAASAGSLRDVDEGPSFPGGSKGGVHICLYVYKQCVYIYIYIYTRAGMGVSVAL